ncbi:MAG: hypothetical protein ACPHLK_09860 [Gammaproteobacteria bacterium]|jgi:hypothetical protein
MDEQHKREMTISLKEFYRLLPFALKDINFEISNNEISMFYANGKILIKPGVEHERKIASLVLPVLYVEFFFSNISDQELKQFYEAFDRAYQRGGG